MITTTAPIQIKSCVINNSKRFVALDAIYITFRNRAATPANEVVFTVSYDNTTQRIVDRGLFSPGVTINHWYRGFDNMMFHGATPQRCVVRYVHFENGMAYAAAAGGTGHRRKQFTTNFVTRRGQRGGKAI